MKDTAPYAVPESLPRHKIKGKKHSSGSFHNRCSLYHKLGDAHDSADGRRRNRVLLQPSGMKSDLLTGRHHHHNGEGHESDASDLHQDHQNKLSEKCPGAECIKTDKSRHAGRRCCRKKAVRKRYPGAGLRGYRQPEQKRTSQNHKDKAYRYDLRRCKHVPESSQLCRQRLTVFHIIVTYTLTHFLSFLLSGAVIPLLYPLDLKQSVPFRSDV